MIRPKVKAGRKRVIVAPQPDLRVMRAAKLDRVADLELALGHSVIAERLARMADGVRAVQEEAGGVLTMLVIRQPEAVKLMADAVLDDAEASRLLTLISQTSKRINVARHTKSPMLCVSCPRPLLDNKFAFVVAGPAGDDAVNHIAVAVCKKCGRSTADITRKATAGLRRLWPDLRPISVHPTAGRA